MNKKFNDFCKFLSDKKIAVIGVGVSNLPLIEVLCGNGNDVTVFDSKNKVDLSKDVLEIFSKYDLKFSLGKDYLEKLVGFDVIFRSPSILTTNSYLKKELERGALVTTEIEQVVRLAPCKIIGVTGSKGKTTTVTIIYNLLKKLGYSTYLGGNIGTPLYSKLSDMKKDDIVVLEMSSFQLMDMKVSPDISVVTNISPDHLDIHGSYEEYIHAKMNIFLHQNEDGIVVLNQDDEKVSNMASSACGSVRFFGCHYIVDSYVLDDDFISYNGEHIIDTKKLLLKGEHNYLNVAASLNAIRDFIHVTPMELEEICCSISPVRHRLEFVREIDGVKWYNDSASTTPDKSLAGISSFDCPIVLIAGGSSKNISYRPLAKAIARKVSKLVLFGQTKNEIYDEVMKLPSKMIANLKIYVVDTLEEVVQVSHEVSVSGEVVLFSPASASFDMFKNAYQRGDEFISLVNKL